MSAVANLGGGVISEETDLVTDFPAALERCFQGMPKGSVGVIMLITPTGVLGSSHYEVSAYTTPDAFAQAIAAKLSPGQIRYHQAGADPAWPKGFSVEYSDEQRKS